MPKDFDDHIHAIEQVGREQDIPPNLRSADDHAPTGGGSRQRIRQQVVPDGGHARGIGVDPQRCCALDRQLDLPRLGFRLEQGDAGIQAVA